MSVAAVLLALAERCEREEPTRELDAAIYIAVFIPVDQARRIDQDGGVVGWWPINKPYSRACEVPCFSSSLDAAVRLIPEGAEYGLGTLYGVAQCEVGLNFSDGTPALGRREDGSVAPCLCAAALRARAAIAKEEG